MSDERIMASWSSARVLRVSGEQVAVAADDPDRPAWESSSTDTPPAGAVLLGAVDGVDHFAVPSADLADGRSLRELGALVGDDDAGLLTTAVALTLWHGRAGYCSRCGRPTAPDPGGWSRRCADDHQEFPRTDPAVIVLVHDGADRMVLARQPVWAPGRYSVLAGFVEAGESMENTVRREMFEEVGARVDHIRYLGSQPWPFPRSLMIGFVARADPSFPLRPQDGEIEDARWVTRAEVREILARSGWGAGAEPAATPNGSRPDAPVATDRIELPSSISIARRMIEGWAAVGG
ncbi:NAD(+) diphosphatase [Nakamurella sp. A5-74]|uniref:NAD(+) diphosphatase n=1 Tax=Nakamurella sp. A5-74 TaxID=3158264 RepID=A0AAU8DSL9_9ACTN